MVHEIDVQSAAVRAIQALVLSDADERQLLHEALQAVPKLFPDASFDLLLPSLARLEGFCAQVIHVEDGEGNRFRLVADEWPGDMAA